MYLNFNLGANIVFINFNYILINNYKWKKNVISISILVKYK